jgi:hypothetical protein
MSYLALFGTLVLCYLFSRTRVYWLLPVLYVLFVPVAFFVLGGIASAGGILGPIVLVVTGYPWNRLGMIACSYFNIPALCGYALFLSPVINLFLITGITFVMRRHYLKKYDAKADAYRVASTRADKTKF